MEPCLFRHGKTALKAERERIEKASMEPCLFRHGKPEGFIIDYARMAELQWSHVFSDMVSSVEGKYLPASKYASMEPCLFRHGKHYTKHYSH